MCSKSILAVCAIFMLIPSIAAAQGPGKKPPMLTWEAVRGAGGYIVEIRDAGGATIVNRKVKAPAYDITLLKKGAYKFRITTLNKLEKPERSSDWVPFEIQKAVIPEFTSISKDMLYFNYDNPGIIIRGDSFTNKTEILIANAKRTVNFSPVRFISETELHAGVVLTKDMEGEYRLIIQNPGGFEAENKTKITVVKPVIPDFDKAEPPYFRQQKGKVKVAFTCGNVGKDTAVAVEKNKVPQNLTVVSVAGDIITVEMDSDKVQSGSYDLVLSNPGAVKKFGDAFRVKEPVEGALQWGGLYVGLGYEGNYCVGDWSPVVKPSFIGALMSLSYSFDNIPYLSRSPRADRLYINFKFDYIRLESSREENRIPGDLTVYRPVIGFSYAIPFGNLGILQSPELLINLGAGFAASGFTGQNIHYSVDITSIDAAFRSGISFRSMLSRYFFFEPGVELNTVLYKGAPMLDIAALASFGIKL